MASTYPLEVVQAERWAKAEQESQGRCAQGRGRKAALGRQRQVAGRDARGARHDEQKLDWTQKLGDAVLAQQADVMDAVQRLRAKARPRTHCRPRRSRRSPSRPAGQAGHRDRTGGSEHGLRAVLQPGGGLRCMALSELSAVLLAAGPATIAAALIAPASCSARASLGRLGRRRKLWGGGIDWGNNNINVDRTININGATGTGRTVRSTATACATTISDVAQKFGKDHVAGRNHGWTSAAVTDSRCSSPMANRATVPARAIVPGAGDRRPGDRPGTGDRPGAGAGKGDRPGAGAGKGDRPGRRRSPAWGGDRPGAGAGKGANRPERRAAPRAAADRRPGRKAGRPRKWLEQSRPWRVGVRACEPWPREHGWRRWNATHERWDATWRRLPWCG